MFYLNQPLFCKILFTTFEIPTRCELIVRDYLEIHRIYKKIKYIIKCTKYMKYFEI